VICSVNGDRLLHVALGMGHNNDKAMLQLSGIKDALLQTGQRFLGDRGYYASVCVVPDEAMGVAWNNRQMGLRSVVERVIGSAMCYGVARGVFHGSPELQAIALMSVYHCVEHALSRSPLMLP
jgi:hypothetical protein